MELRWTGRDWWWQGQGCWQYSGGRLAVVVEWRLSGGGGGGGVAVDVAHELKVSYLVLTCENYLSPCIKMMRTNRIYLLIV